MPEISLFYGIRVTMNWLEHTPPHFHVEYAGNKAIILIQESIINKGYLPNRQLKLVLAWCEIHKDELMQNNKPNFEYLFGLLELAKDKKPLNRINPLI